MNAMQAIRARDALIRRLIDAASVARVCHTTHAALMDSYKDAFNKVPKATPKWIVEYARGYLRAIDADRYNNDLVYGGYCDGRFISTHRSRADYYQKCGIDPIDFAPSGRVSKVGHYWATDTSKPFSISQDHAR